MNIAEGYLSPTQAALRLGVAPQTLKFWERGAKLTEVLHTPVGRLYTVAEIERVAAERQGVRHWRDGRYREAAKQAPSSSAQP